ncbi:MAG: nucleotidyltransferase domain-containing protein [Planctomycetes bacterium]|nr:nucleotidyltransferase domain-containing protein [Planctomycetota bacterium]
MAGETLIDRAAQALSRAAPAGSEVYLFGSHATGRARPESDLDFLIVEPMVTDRLAEMFRLRKAVEAALGDRVVAVDVIVIDRARFVRLKDRPNTLANEVSMTGRRCAS